MLKAGRAGRKGRLVAPGAGLCPGVGFLGLFPQMLWEHLGQRPAAQQQLPFRVLGQDPGPSHALLVPCFTLPGSQPHLRPSEPLLSRPGNENKFWAWWAGQ